MLNSPSPSSPELNRLRAASALIPIIESGLAEFKLLADRAALMASFCEWAAEITPSDPERAKLLEDVFRGLERLKERFTDSE